ncbi:MAG: cytochrome c family protein [Saprospiraceae bacterium]|nr:cytochrome c family protein [Candidatus Defluviibacterium haderslevense]
MIKLHHTSLLELKYILYGILIICFFPLSAQISPGKLSNPHKQLEGISNCTQCHDLGDQISEAKCLNCHIKLKSRISSNKGFHASQEVKQKNCISCHSEHHGLKFEMIRFDKKLFNHNSTGYELKGKHKTIDCRNCHKPDFIQDPEIKKNQTTYLGLDPKCLTCHADYHQKTLSNDCIKCHNFNQFKPASEFNHSRTDFPLTGAHLKVTCIECHKKEIRNNVSFQKFASIDFQTCHSCHKDPHDNKFGTNCKACHTDESFHKIKPTPQFNHNLTGFKLEGRHKSIDCRKCHDNRAGTSGMFKEFEKISKLECISCHKDIHEGKFETDCKKCHNQESFRANKNLDQFNHNLTNFPLEGKHQSLDCKKCHKTKMTDPLPHEFCNQCHTDYHHGEFAQHKIYNDCSSCHTVQNFKGTTFSIEQHQQSAFPLNGAHLATACNACHQKDGKWNFRNIGKQCIDCHEDFHKGYIDPSFYVPNQCLNCHAEESWNEVHFDHSKTSFPLLGKHLETQCNKCHFTKELNKAIVQNFKEKPKECNTCHKNPHGNQFTENNITDCNRCHGFDDWKASKFNHNNSRFPLKGEHIVVTCDKCHKAEALDIKIILYKNGMLECKDCHK